MLADTGVGGRGNGWEQRVRDQTGTEAVSPFNSRSTRISQMIQPFVKSYIWRYSFGTKGWKENQKWFSARFSDTLGVSIISKNIVKLSKVIWTCVLRCRRTRLRGVLSQEGRHGVKPSSKEMSPPPKALGGGLKHLDTVQWKLLAAQKLLPRIPNSL